MVVYNVDHPHFVGGLDIPGHASYVAETSAMLWALLWSLQLDRENWPKQIHYHFDNITVGMQAFYGWGAHAQPVIGRALRELGVAAQQAYTVKFWHIHGHCNHPWNELADTLCDAVSKASCNS